jgi:hypothetical protein
MAARSPFAGRSVTGIIVGMSSRHSHLRQHRPWWARAAQLGQAGWFFGNLYEGVVGMPQLLMDARPMRQPRLLATGSPVRYFVPVAAVALGATGITLSKSWRSGAAPRLTTAAAASVGAALGLSAYLIRMVNLPLLTSSEPLTDPERRRLAAIWHRTNAARLVSLAVASALLSRLETAHG